MPLQPANKNDSGALDVVEALPTIELYAQLEIKHATPVERRVTSELFVGLKSRWGGGDHRDHLGHLG